jgi:hypothetical protein
MRNALINLQIIKHLKFFNGIVFVFLLVSCQRSQFATTTRHYKNGRIIYSKSYSHEVRIATNNKFFRSHLKQENNSETVEFKTDQTYRIKKFIPVHQKSEEILIASSSAEPVYLKTGINENGSVEEPVISNKHLQGLIKSSASPDTILKNNASQPSGSKTISAVKRKIEKHGLTGFILSIFGLFPILGLPLAILALIFGIKSLRKIHKNPTLYKGKGFAIAAIAIGVFGILLSLLFIGVFVSFVIWANSGSSG